MSGQAVRTGRYQMGNAHMERLEQIQRTYRDKRTLGWRLLDDVLRLLDSALIEADAKSAGRIEDLEKRLDIYVKRCDQLSEARRLRETRDLETGDETVSVNIDKSLKGWVVGDLEEIAYRLRCGGATDDTPVKITEWSATASVPAPNLVPLTRPNGVQYRQVAIPEHAPRQTEVAQHPFWLTHPERTIKTALIGAAFILSVLLGRWVY